MADNNKSDQWNFDDFGAAMAAESKEASDQAQPPQDQPAMVFRGHYVKNLSFDGPGLSRKVQGQPKTSLNYDINLKELSPNLHEVAISVTAQVNDDQEKLITLTLNYGVIYQLNNIPAEHHERLLISEGGRYIFPYMQRLVADVMREGGLPGFQLPQIDFYRAYEQIKQSK